MAGSDGLVVASFNIRNGLGWDGRNAWPFRRGATAGAIGRLEADVVGLQEVHRFQERSLRRRLGGYQAVGVGRSDGRRRGERCLVLWRPERLSLLGHRTHWFGDDPDRPGSRLAGAGAPRVATIATFAEAATGATVVVVDTHLDERSSTNRQRSAEQLLGWLDLDVATVVVGDLNAEAGDPALQALVDAGLSLAVPASAGGTSHRWDGRTDGRRLDHILISHHWDVVDAGVDHRRWHGRLPSDHWPTWARLNRR